MTNQYLSFKSIYNKLFFTENAVCTIVKVKCGTSENQK